MLNLLWGLAFVLFLMWLVGFTLHATFGGAIHLLLALAVASVLIRIIMGRRIA